jgi:carboxyl-terminal processing protease
MSRALIAGAILGAGLVSGGMLMQSGAWREAAAVPASPRLLEQVMARLRRDYIDTISVDDMYRRATFGFVKELDDANSILLTPEQTRRLRESTTGKYAGVGLDVDIRDGFVTVVAPLAGSPADSAGIKPGDRIITIDDWPTHGHAMIEVQQKLRGLAGSTVKLGIERGEQTPTFTLRRRDLIYHPIRHARLLQGGIGYVEMTTFSEIAASELRQTVDSLRGRGARSLIIDLRENPGGLLDQGIAVAELFLDPPQTIASTRGRVPEANRTYKDERKQVWPGMPVVALVDSGTASAAEILAGALQDNGRAVLVGSETYGKGSAQSVYPVSEGNALKLTTALWLTPKGRSIQRDSTSGGIKPDVEARSFRELREGVDGVLNRAVGLLAGVQTPDQLRAKVPRR